MSDHMKTTRKIDIIVNVFLPLLLGYFIYNSGDAGRMNLLVKNHLPDGLWAYSFMAAILIIWNRQVNYVWIAIACLLSGGFELMQCLHWVAGTGDIMDILAYLIFIGLAILINHYSRKIYTVQSG
jgi:hypothetical protein